MTLAEKEKIREAQRAYNRGYYQKNKKTILERNKKWREDNPDKVQEANKNYWLRKSEELQN